LERIYIYQRGLRNIIDHRIRNGSSSSDILCIFVYWRRSKNTFW